MFNNKVMLTNNLRIALRSTMRNKGYSFINIAGLAVGMCVTMLIGMWVYDELTFNHYHSNHKQIGEIYQHQAGTEGDINTIMAGCGPLAGELLTTYPNDFRHVVRMWWESDHMLSIDDHRITQNGTYMDADVLEMLSLKMLSGNWSS